MPGVKHKRDYRENDNADIAEWIRVSSLPKDHPEYVDFDFGVYFILVYNVCTLF